MAGDARHRVFRQKVGGKVETLLNSLTVDQLNSALAKLTGGSVRGSRSREDAEEKVATCGRSVRDITFTLHEVEAETPQRHCFVGYWEGNLPVQGIVQDQKGLEESEFQFVHSHEGADYRVLTFEQNVVCERWVRTDARTQHLQTLKIRHPMIVRIYLQLPIILIQYPGISARGGVRKDRAFTYEGAVEKMLDVLRRHFSVSVSPVPIRRTIEFLSGAESNRIRLVRANPATNSGRMIVTTGYQDLSVSTWLANFISPHFPGIDFNKLERAAQEAVTASSLSSLVVVWVQERVFTRIDFWNIGSELLFVWHETPPSYYVIDSILALLHETSDCLGDLDDSRVMEFVGKQDVDALFLPAELASRFGLSAEVTKRIIERSVRAGLIVPIFRIKSDELLAEAQNSWTPSLVSLRRVFTTIDGKEVDGSDPRNIEVGFRPAGGRAPRATQ